MSGLPYAAVLHDDESDAGDLLLQRFVSTLQQRGWRVRGLITSRGKDPERRLPMLISDLRDGRSYAISQTLGSGSTSCCLDPSGLMEASSVLRDALAERPDLVSINRFGVMEASGRGFYDEILALVSAGIPLLTLVNPKYQAAWLAFSGAADSLLPLQESALHAWADALPTRPLAPTA